MKKVYNTCVGGDAVTKFTDEQKLAIKILEKKEESKPQFIIEIYEMEEGELSWVENGKFKTSKVDPEKYGSHCYPGAPDLTSDCEYECGCWAGPFRSGGPVSPWGPCPKNLKG